MSKTKLLQAITSVNNRYAKGLNDDDQVFKMVTIDKQTKGYSFFPLYDSYKLISDTEKMKLIVLKYGYWSKETESFNDILLKKGGYDYMVKLNSPYTGTGNGKIRLTDEA